MPTLPAVETESTSIFVGPVSFWRGCLYPLTPADIVHDPDSRAYVPTSGSFAGFS